MLKEPSPDEEEEEIRIELSDEYLQFISRTQMQANRSANQNHQSNHLFRVKSEPDLDNLLLAHKIANNVTYHGKKEISLPEVVQSQSPLNQQRSENHLEVSRNNDPSLAIRFNGNYLKYVENRITFASNGYRCLGCKINFQLKQTLDTHLTNNPRCNAIHIVVNCPKNINRAKALAVHSADYQAPSTPRQNSSPIIPSQPHMESIHTPDAPVIKQPEVFPCQPCDLQFATQSEQKKKKRRKTSSCRAKSYQCQICKMQFQSNYMRSLHWRASRTCDEQLWTNCSECSAKFKTAHGLEKHLQKSHVICNLCGKKFGQISKLTLHIKYKHFRTKKVQCQYCKKSFLAEELDEHMSPENCWAHQACTTSDQKLPGEGPTAFACVVCDKSFKSELVLLKHQSNTHTVFLTTCDICELSFGKLFHLHRHRNEAHGEKLECRICSKKFDVPWQLRRHSAFHNGYDAHKCNVCELSYKTGSSLSYHKLRHHGTGEKKELCNVCGKAFMMRPSLKLHMKEVHADGIFECPTCKKTFKSKSSMKSHSLLHTVVENFKCAACGNKYKSSQYLHYHIRTVSKCREQFRFKCRHCKSKFITTGEFEKHLQKCHPDFPHCIQRIRDMGYVNYRIKHSGIAAESCEDAVQKALTDDAQSDNESEDSIIFGEPEPHLTENTAEGEMQTHIQGAKSDEPGSKAERMESEAKAFPCVVCAQNFQSASELLKHQALIHTVLLTMCDICYAPFTQLSTMHRHRTKVHGDKLE